MRTTLICVLVSLGMMITGCLEGDSNELDIANGSESSEQVMSDGITIGDQVWQTKNLDVETFRNGDPIPHADSEESWTKAGENKQPAWCYYETDASNGETYGKLYNWYAVNDPRGLAPEGWGIPSDEDWSRLTDFLGGKSVAGKKIKHTDFWSDYQGEPGTNESGFSGLPGGYRYVGGSFDDIGENGYWWSSTENNAHSARSILLKHYTGDVVSSANDKVYGLSVRCIKD